MEVHDIFKPKLGNVFGNDDLPSVGTNGYRPILNGSTYVYWKRKDEDKMWKNKNYSSQEFGYSLIAYL